MSNTMMTCRNKSELVVVRSAVLSFLFASFLCGTGTVAAEISVPTWMVGDWPVSRVYQNGLKTYHPQPGPKAWWSDKVFKVSQDELSFADWVCKGPHLTLMRGPLAKPVRAKTGASLADLGLPPGKGAVSYYNVICNQSLVRDPSDSTKLNDMQISLPWSIVVRSRAAIAMPFQASSFVEFSRGKPSS